MYLVTFQLWWAADKKMGLGFLGTEYEYVWLLKENKANVCQSLWVGGGGGYHALTCLQKEVAAKSVVVSSSTETVSTAHGIKHVREITAQKRCCCCYMELAGDEATEKTIFIHKKWHADTASCIQAQNIIWSF